MPAEGRKSGNLSRTPTKASRANQITEDARVGDEGSVDCFCNLTRRASYWDPGGAEQKVSYCLFGFARSDETLVGAVAPFDGLGRLANAPDRV